MRDGQIRFFPQSAGNQLHSAKTQPEYLADLTLAVVPPHQLVVQMKKVGQFAHLKAVSRGESDGITALGQLANDGRKKWHVRRVVQIDPDLRLAGRSIEIHRIHNLYSEKARVRVRIEDKNVFKGGYCGDTNSSGALAISKLGRCGKGRLPVTLAFADTN